jgi:peroxiredoxin
MPLSSSTRLQDRLDAITSNTRALVQPERLAVGENFVQGLLDSGIEQKVLAVGSVAPSFELEDALTKKRVRSSDLLAVGPVVVKFFRGRWCPYCVTELGSWQELYARVRERGGLLVAISPQLPRQNDFTVQQHELTFPILSDPGAKVAESFGVAYTVPEFMQRHYRSILVNIPFVNGEESWQLPLPAVFVVGQDGIVRYAEAHADFRVRAEPEDVLAVL